VSDLFVHVGYSAYSAAEIGPTRRFSAPGAGNTRWLPAGVHADGRIRWVPTDIRGRPGSSTSPAIRTY